ncbi:uncharacterized protein LOC103983382 [Musa acuminata AAA Group]|uniref:uncharacterized protein LOC103983382 n=1 Tax=Musa acuminata AAA Group TaxID=214697 RepID=UPI0031DC485A
MPSHHHRETNRCCCGCSIHSSPPPHLTTSDQLLQALASHLLLQSQKPPTVSDRHCLKPQQHPPPLHSFFQIHQLGDDHLPPAPPHYHRHEQQQQQQRFYQYQAQPLIDSLLRRVAALESSFPHLSPTSSPSPPVDPRSPTRPTSIPDTSPRKPWIFSFDWMSSIGDPMVREGKRSISRELVRTLDFIDKWVVKEHQLSLDAIEITGNCGIERDSVEDMRREIVGTEEVTKPSKRRKTRTLKG